MRLWPPKSELSCLLLGCRYHGLQLDLLRVTIITSLRLVRHGGGAKSIYSGASPPLTPFYLTYRPRETACSARNYLAVSNLRPPRRGVMQTKTIALHRMM